MNLERVCLFTRQMTFPAREPRDQIMSVCVSVRACVCVCVCECVFTRKMKSGLLLVRETGDRLSVVDVSSELCEDGCRNV